MASATILHPPAGLLSSPHGQRRSWARGLWAWLLVAMVLAQTLGFMHTIVHALTPNQSHPASSVYLLPEHIGEHTHGSAHAASHEPLHEGWLAQLFNTHGDTSDCRLFDHVSHGDGLPGVPALTIPTLTLPVFLPVFEAVLPLATAALVRARGPPLLR